jgi:hypothetical protein
MPHRARPMTGMLVFLGVNLVLVNTISPVYDFVCFHPYWERRVLHSLSSSAFPSQKASALTLLIRLASAFDGCQVFAFALCW